MPAARPLRPISHWRSGKPAIVIPWIVARVLKTQPLRNPDRFATMGELEPISLG